MDSENTMNESDGPVEDPVSSDMTPFPPCQSENDVTTAVTDHGPDNIVDTSMVEAEFLEGEGCSELAKEEGSQPQPTRTTTIEDTAAWKEELKEQVISDMQSAAEQMESATKLLLEHVHTYIDSSAQFHECYKKIQEKEHREKERLESFEKDVEEHVGPFKS